MNEKKKKGYSPFLGSRKEQPLVDHMYRDSGVLDPKFVKQTIKNEVRLFKERQKELGRMREEAGRRDAESIYQRQMQRFEAERKLINDRINKLKNSRVVD